MSVVLLAVSLSLDSLSVGLTYGTRGLRVGAPARLILGLASMSLSALALGLGQAAAGLVPPGLSRWAGALVLMALGAALAWRGLRSPTANGDPCPTAWEIRLRSLGLVIQILREPVSADVDRSGEVTPSESLALGLALAADSVGAGFGAALSGYRSWLLPPAVGLACTLLFALGHRLGSRSPWRLTGRAALLPGIFLMGLGILRLL
ncbi:MAG: sporulation membrane protein YtaF [Bacillota bacterium]